MKCSKQGLKSSASNSVANYESSPSCYAQVDKNGDYIFKNVAPGKYLVQPVIEDSKLKLNIKPSYFEFEVTKDTLELKEEFKVIYGKINLK